MFIHVEVAAELDVTLTALLHPRGAWQAKTVSFHYTLINRTSQFNIFLCTYLYVAAKLRFGSTTNLSHAADSSASPTAYDVNGGLTWDRHSDYSDEDKESLNEREESVWIDLSKLGSVFSHEGSSLYLRLGELSK